MRSLVVGLEERCAEIGADFPVVAEGVDVVGGDAAEEVAADVLNVLRLLGVDVAGQVEIEVVLLDFIQGDEARVAGMFLGVGEHIDDLVEVAFAEAVFVAVPDEALRGVDHEDPLAGGGVLLIEHEDALEGAGSDEVSADDSLGISPEENAVGENAGTLAAALHGADDVEQEGVVALLGGRLAPLEALVGIMGRRETGGPSLNREGWVGDDEIVSAEFSPSLNLGSERVFPVRMFAVGKSCRIMFMRARPAVVTSISWPSRVMCLPASEATFSKREANPQVGS